MRGPNNPPKRLFYLTYNGEWEPVTLPPLISRMSSSDLEQIREQPLVCNIPCHSQTVEHTVALVTQATKRRRTEENQLMSVLQVSSARKECQGTVTHKRLSQSEDQQTTPKSSRKVQRFENTEFNKVLYK